MCPIYVLVITWTKASEVFTYTDFTGRGDVNCFTQRFQEVAEANAWNPAQRFHTSGMTEE